MSKPTQITNELLQAMIYQAYLRLEENAEDLNKINVFPVADGDTGDNMLRTWKSALLYIQDVDLGLDISVIARDLVEVLLLDSRGNSGTVLSQIFSGFFEPFRVADSLDSNTLKESFKLAKDKAFQSFQDPKTGTILDILRDIDKYLAGVEPELELETFFQKLLVVARKSLFNTKYSSAINQKANVVDAGAAGLVYILEGFVIAIAKHNIEPTDLETGKMSLLEGNKIKYRYCTEVVLDFDSEESSELLNRVKAFGDSVQAQILENRIKIHIHTNEPEKFRNLLAEYGSVVEYKADDMVVMQSENLRKLRHVYGSEKGQGLVFLVDSFSDIPASYFAKYNIVVEPIPLYVKTPNGNLDVDMEVVDFYREMKNNPTFVAKTSQISVGSWLKQLKHLTKEYEKVVCLPINSALSKSLNSLQIAIRSLEKNHHKIHTLDTLSGSFGNAFYIREIAKAYQQGLDLEEFINQIPTAKPKILFMVEDTNYLIRGGRLTGAKSWLGKILQIQPVLTLDSEGRIQSTKQKALFKNFQANLNFMLKELEKDIEDSKVAEIYLGFSDQQSQAYVDYLETRIREKIGSKSDYIKIYREPITLVVGAHAGPGLLGLIYF